MQSKMFKYLLSTKEENSGVDVHPIAWDSTIGSCVFLPDADVIFVPI
jgi:hypothetical protein